MNMTCWDSEDVIVGLQLEILFVDEDDCRSTAPTPYNLKVKACGVEDNIF